jgi:hypothetical protein
MRNENGTFRSGNKGKPKGSVNKSTVKVREAYTKLLEDNLGQLTEDFKELDPKDRIRLFLDLSKYVIPQLKQVEGVIDNINHNINTDLTEKEAKLLKKQILSEY